MSELDIFAVRLLDFAQQSVMEGLNDPSSMRACFMEADSSLRILGKTLQKEDATRNGALVLLRLFDYSFVEFANNSDDVRKQLEKVIYAKSFFAPGG